MENLSDLLSRLDEVKAGDNILDALTAEKINAIFLLLKGLAAGDNIKTGLGTGLTKESQPASVLLKALPQAARQREPEHPFKARIQSATYTAGVFTSATVKVDHGMVFETESADGTGVTIGALSDTHTLLDGELILLEVFFSLTGTITAINIGPGTLGAYPALYDNFGASGNAWYHPIARIRTTLTGEQPDFGTDKKFEQLCFTHLVAKQHKNFDDVTIWGLTPYPLGGKASDGGAFTVWEENSSGSVSDVVTVLNFIGKRTIAATGNTVGGIGANIVDVTVGTIAVLEGASQRAEALKTLNFEGDGVTVSSEAGAGVGEETGDGAVTVTINGIPDGYEETTIIATVWDEQAQTITARKLKVLADDLGVFSGQ